MFASVFITLALAAFGSALPQKRALAEVITKCTVPNTAALTFDDGPYWFVYDVSKALIAANGTGTFFFNGDNYGGCIYNEDQAKRVKYAYDKGHQVASHTWSHAHLNTLTWDQLHDEFWRVEEALMKITGAYPAFVRPPFGEYNNLVREVAGVRGQKIAMWDFDSGDSMGLTPAQSNQRYTDLANARPSNVLTLNHDVYQTTAHVIVPHAIAVLQQAGYRLVSLAECVGQAPYQWVSAPATRDASWTC